MSIYFYGKVPRLLVEGEAYFGGLTIVRHAIFCVYRSHLVTHATGGAYRDSHMH